MVPERLKSWEMMPRMASASQRRLLAKRRPLAEKGMAWRGRLPMSRVHQCILRSRLAEPRNDHGASASPVVRAGLLQCRERQYTCSSDRWPADCKESIADEVCCQ